MDNYNTQALCLKVGWQKWMCLNKVANMHSNSAKKTYQKGIASNWKGRWKTLSGRTECVYRLKATGPCACKVFSCQQKQPATALFVTL